MQKNLFYLIIMISLCGVIEMWGGFNWHFTEFKAGIVLHKIKLNAIPK